MNNRIKFRVYCSTTKSFSDQPWLSPDGLELMWCHTGSEASFTDIRFDTYRIQQFTGVTDKNGNEIYEGDILLSSRKVARWFGSGTNFVVAWNRYLCNYALIPTYFYSESDESNQISNNADLTVPKGKYMSVIGNICENPELLK